MRRNKIEVYIHLVWETWDRQPMITTEIERRLLRNIENEAIALGCQVLAVNCVPDHVHVLVSTPSTIGIAELVKQMKGVSSHFANETLSTTYQFKWQGSYGAFSVSRWDLDRIVQYIKRQKEHHATGELLPELETTFEQVAQ